MTISISEFEQLKDNQHAEHDLKPKDLSFDDALIYCKRDGLAWIYKSLTSRENEPNNHFYETVTELAKPIVRQYVDEFLYTMIVQDEAFATSTFVSGSRNRYHRCLTKLPKDYLGRRLNRLISQTRVRAGAAALGKIELRQKTTATFVTVSETFPRLGWENVLR